MPVEKRITLDEAYVILKAEEQEAKVSAGKLFHVKFARKNPRKPRKGRDSVTPERADGVRWMQCRFGVKSFLKGGPEAYNPAKYALIVAFDVQEQEYRSISLDNILEMTIKGTHYIIM